MRVPSGLKAAEYTNVLWPRRTAISLAVAASQMRAVASRDAVTMRFPLGLKVEDQREVAYRRSWRLWRNADARCNLSEQRLATSIAAFLPPPPQIFSSLMHNPG